MPNEQKTIEELLIELDAADTQLSNESAQAIRKLNEKLITAWSIVKGYRRELIKSLHELDKLDK